MLQRARRYPFVVVATAVALLWGVVAARGDQGAWPIVARHEDDPALMQDLAFFTTSELRVDPAHPACAPHVKGIRLDTGGVVVSDARGLSPLRRLRASPDLDVVVAGFAMWPAAITPATNGLFGSIQVLRRAGGGWNQWDVAPAIVGRMFYSGIDILPDDDTLLVATGVWTPGYRTDGTWSAPFRVESYSLADVLPLTPAPDERATHRLGNVRGAIEIPDPALAIEHDPAGRRAHLLTHSTDSAARLTVRTIDVSTMAETAAPITLPLPASYPESRLSATNTALSPDGRYLVTTANYSSSINVADLHERTAWSLPIPDVLAVTDLSFSHGTENYGLLAVNVRVQGDGSGPPTWPFPSTSTQVLIAELRRDGIVELGRGPRLVSWMPKDPAAVEWTSDGDGVIAAVDWPGPAANQPPIRPLAYSLNVADGGRTVTKLRDIDPCPGADFVMDILTGNGYKPTPTPSPSSTASASPTQTASLTPLPSASPTSTATATCSPTPTLPPRPIYLPIALRERCDPGTQRIDVALVVDASTTMRDDLTSAGRPKLSAAIEAARAFLATMSLPQDQAAIVVFNEKALVTQELTGRRADVEAALVQIPRLVRLQTRIDLGIEEAHKELTSARRKPANRPVMILLTDGLANPVPASTAVWRAQAAKDDHVMIFTIGLGKPEDLDVAELQQMASRRDYFYLAPDGEDLQTIYRSIAVTIPCPPESFWGRR